ncbi:MAG TPA: NAD-dependent epimerase/dehydratase family protein [Fibrobacteria bacterium]|jgi:uncharacterized protein YbjT (DUF2867 family)|nr:NAD-dependent epimerase/dehydratase family protein [Fibrobacteria bacterium]
MKILIFGATGMVGRGTLRECLADSRVESVLSVGRSACGETHAKLREILLPDLFDLSSASQDLSGFDACLYCLGASPATLSARAYRRVTVDLTLSVARFLAPRNPGMTFVYVSGAGVNPGRRTLVHTLRAKGEVEAALAALPFRATCMLRPGLIRPLDGIRSRTVSHRLFYAMMEPLMPLFVRMLPGLITDTRRLGRAMLRAASGEVPRVLETRQINEG